MNTRALPSAAPRNVTHWIAVLAATLCGIAVAANVGKVAITLPQLREGFGLSLTQAGWVSSAINTLAVSLGLFIGFLGDRVGPLRLCLVGLALAIAGGIGALFADGFVALLASRFVEGAGYMAVAVSGPALLSAAATLRDRRFALGIWSCFIPAGIGLVMIAAPLLDALGGWAMVWVFTIALLAVAMFGLLRFRAEYHVPAVAGDDGPALAMAREALARPQPWILAIAFGCWALQHFTLIVWLPTFLSEQRGLPPMWVAALSCLMVIVNVPGNLLGGALVQRNLPRGGLIAGASVVTGLSAVGLFSDALPDLVRYALCLAVSFTGGLIPSSIISSSTVLARTPRQIGTLQGLFMQGSNLGTFVGPPLIAFLVARRGEWGDAMWLPFGAACLCCVLGLLILRLERRAARG